PTDGDAIITYTTLFRSRTRGAQGTAEAGRVHTDDGSDRLDVRAAGRTGTGDGGGCAGTGRPVAIGRPGRLRLRERGQVGHAGRPDRKSTRLNSSHVSIS